MRYTALISSLATCAWLFLPALNRSARADITLNTVPVWDGSDTADAPPGYTTYQSIGQFGTAAQNASNSPTIGETFIDPAGATILNYFTFYLQGAAGSQINFQGEVFNWTGSLLAGDASRGAQGTAGAPLYTSSTINYTADNLWDAVTINIPGGVAVAPGNPYVIDITATDGAGNATFGNTWLYLTGDFGPTTGGSVNFSNPPATEYGPWNEPGFGFYGDLAFTADFSSVPEPTAMIAGLSLFVLFGSRVRR
ncbi:MAG TPA: hypothetical protein VGG19_11385 [Tepidisphaeraceae bacterium]|jgi:hypothetical protein